MTENTPPEPPSDPLIAETQPGAGADGWDPRQVMRQRAETTRSQRGTAIADLRARMSDEQALEEFGIVLGEIEL
jgi:hypothetical protein